MITERILFMKYDIVRAGKLNSRFQEVRERGADVLQSEIFREMLEKKHHMTTIGYHSIMAAVFALRISDMLGHLGIHTDRDILVRMALCHDLGMIERHTLYPSMIRCCSGHPKEGVRVYEKYFRKASPREKDCILHHMWPATPIPPTTREGAVINLADKCSSITELIEHLSNTTTRLSEQILFG